MGPNTQKHKNAQAKSQAESKPAGAAAVPLELQQALLNVFLNALRLDQLQDLKSLIQQVKGHLFRRDFSGAFGSEDYLTAYALRWSASRALAYAEIFASLHAQYRWFVTQHPLDAGPPCETSDAPHVVCFGGGAGAELLAFAAVAHQLPIPRLSATVIDIGDWSSVLRKLHTSLTDPPQLSQYASTSAKATNKPLLKIGQLQMYFERQDILDYAEDQLRQVLAGVSLVTIMFTLNELFASSIANASAFLLAVTDAMCPNTWLLIVDSAGSYSEVTVGKEGQTKKYPMKWLLDHTLLQVAGKDSSGLGKWRKCLTDNSRWFRIDAKLDYPVELENMRYQIHLYHRQGNGDRVE